MKTVIALILLTVHLSSPAQDLPKDNEIVITRGYAIMTEKTYDEIRREILESRMLVQLMQLIYADRIVRLESDLNGCRKQGGQ